MPAACALCGSWRATACFPRPDNSRIVKCAQCGLLYVSPRPAPETLDRHYRQSDPDYILNYKDQIEKRGQAILARAEKYLPPGLLLDVGCGYGFFMAMAQAGGWRTKGIELSAAAAGYAREKLGLDVFAGSLAEAGLAGKSFDLISLEHTLEHIPDPPGLLNALRKLLKDDGILAIAVPNAESLPARWAGAAWIGFAEKTHLFHYTTRTLANLLDYSAFVPVVTETFQWDTGDLLWSAKTFLKKLLGASGQAENDAGQSGQKELSGREEADGRSTQNEVRRGIRFIARIAAPLGWAAGKLALGAEIIVLAKKDLRRGG